jgi:hypothetical protein
LLVVVDAGPEGDAPTPTQFVVVTQLTDKRSSSPVGGEVGLQLTPPSAETSRGRAVTDADTDPAATHVRPLRHHTRARLHDPEGMDRACQVAPPSLVTIPVAANDGSRFPAALLPTATQFEAVGHEMLVNVCAPPSTPRSCQVAPPSLLTRITSPTATQNVAVGQLTASSAGEPTG